MAVAARHVVEFAVGVRLDLFCRAERSILMAGYHPGARGREPVVCEPLYCFRSCRIL